MTDYEKQIKAFWEKRGADNSERSSRFHSDHTEFDLAALMKLIPPGSKVLDLGCGRGEIAQALAEAGYFVTAVDFMPDFVAHIVTAPNIQTDVCDARTYDAGPASFDAIIMLGLITSFLSVEDRKSLYRQAHRMLRRDGLLFVKAQFGVHEDVLIDKWSEDLGMHYVGIYPARAAEQQLLERWFDVELHDPYPDALNRYSNTRMHYLSATPIAQVSS
jgi:cyclopropane fatty-acyl-phospholipid synthase-like methyltransferase